MFNNINKERKKKEKPQELTEQYPEGRKRATKACLGCKSKHTKCGFLRPCMRCQSLGIQCEDDIPKKRFKFKNKKKKKLIF